MIEPMRLGHRRVTAAAGFALLALLTELTGRALTNRLDGMFNVAPLATPTTRYYPFLLAGVRTLAALVVAAAVWRVVRAHASASAGERLLGGGGRRPRPRLRLSPRLWMSSFAVTALFYLVQNDAVRLSQGRWPLLAPWLHTYALPVFAVCSILLAVGWGAVRDWLADVEEYAAATFARASRMLRAVALRPRPRLTGDDRAPRRLFGQIFESRPPPLPV
jgi:hypothetical protein